MAPEPDLPPNLDETASQGPRRPRRPVAHRWHDAWLRSFERPWTWLAVFVLLGTWSLGQGGFLFAPRILPGAVADRDHVASRDLLFEDEEATRRKQGAAREAVLPVYDLDSGLVQDRDRAFADLFARGRQALARPVQEKLGDSPSARTERLDRAARADLVAREWIASPSQSGAPEGVRLTLAQVTLLARRGFTPDLEDRVRGLLTQVLRRGVVDNKPLLLEQRLRGITVRDLANGREAIRLDLFGHLGYPAEVQDLLELEVRGWSGWSGDERRQLVGLLMTNLTPNLLLNRSETLGRQQAAASGVARVLNQMRKGQVIVRKGDVVDASHARLIAQVHGDRRFEHRLPALLATLALLALAAAVPFVFAAGGERVRKPGDGPGERAPRRVAECLFLLALALPGLKFFLVVGNALSNVFDGPPFDSSLSYAYAAPYAALALLAALLLGRLPAFVLASLFAILASRFDVDGLWITSYAFTGGLAAIHGLDRLQFRHRLVIARVGLVVGAVNVAMVLVLTALSTWDDRSAMQIGFDLVCALVSGFLVAAVASFALPILEWLLGVTTDITLVELSNTNLPLLRRLAFEAPGTFQHSLMVANLVKEGSEGIGADPVLGYAAGLYHDVGKVVRPDYFIENQRGGRNRHDKLLPSMSALILASHIRDGLELGRDHGLPQILLDAIAQHHGTRLMRFFFSRALEARSGRGPDGEAGDAAEVSEEAYRYPGPKPQSKVMGVLMLADAVEAASRTLAEPGTARIRSLIHTIVDDCLRDGQLDHTDLTLADLRSVAEAFERVLANIYHQRVDYPGFDFNAKSRRSPRAQGALPSPS